MSSYKRTRYTQIELPPLLSSELPFIFDDYSLALHLGIHCRTLWYLIWEKERLYTTFRIPKANGKWRIIYHPTPRLKYVQRRIAHVILNPLPVLPCVGAYVKGKGCVHTAEKHVQKYVLIKMDLKDFFPSHRRTTVRHFFQSLGYSAWVSGLLADVCTVKVANRHFVPQGSPVSPVLCNHIAQRRLDTPLLQALDLLGWTYTRYADDLTLSHAAEQSPGAVSDIISLVTRYVRQAGYRVNRKKLKVQYQSQQQKILGMVINQKPNIPQKTYRKYRAILTNCYHHGFLPNALLYGGDFIDAPEAFASHLQGKVNYFKNIHPQRGTQLAELLQKAMERHQEEFHARTT